MVDKEKEAARAGSDSEPAGSGAANPHELERTLQSDLTTMETMVRHIHDLTVKVAQDMEKARIAEYTELLFKPWKLIWVNILAGTARGVGIAIGFTFFAATILYILQGLGALNLPIIGDYIADIVRIVQRQLEGKTY